MTLKEAIKTLDHFRLWTLDNVGVVSGIDVKNIIDAIEIVLDAAKMYESLIKIPEDALGEENRTWSLMGEVKETDCSNINID